jgi:hypothetical protein
MIGALIPHFSSLASSALVNAFLLLLARHSWSYLALFTLGFCSLSILIRPRYLLIHKDKGLLYYSLPILGHKSYYFVEVCGIQLEVDMSKVLLKLHTPKLHRLYLKLHSGKRLLVYEDTVEDEIVKISQTLQEVFGIQEIEHLRRIGRKTGQELRLGDYTLEKELSHGGMGKVFLAKDKRTGSRVALKVLPACFALDDNYVTNFARETRILQKLSHSGIVRILDVGRENGREGDVYFFAMEFIEGRPLSDLIAKRELTYETSARFALEVALA